MIRKMVLLVVLVATSLAEAWSQKGLSVAELFDGSYKRKDNAIEVMVIGEKLRNYNLTLFRSLTVKDDPQDFVRIERLVEADGAAALSKETGRIGERLYYGFYCLSPVGKRYRYLFFRNSSLRKEESNELTLIYMEGNVSMDELKKLFKKR